MVYAGKKLPYSREFNAVFISFPKSIAKGSKQSFTVYYGGKPTVAKRAPWDGGFVFTTDTKGLPWVATACQGLGASVWWPNKDHQADEVDSMLISIAVPKGLKDVSNGRLRSVTDLPNGYTRFDWFVANPINNYDVAANIGNYIHMADSYAGEKGKLSLDYWVLPADSAAARHQFDANVKPMLKAFEHWFGPYPFYEDGYKLVQTPHLGMEHQSAVAYGNGFKNGYRGSDLSGTGWGLKWDFIIVHESGHEWFGNNITSKDLADMWIHESFTNYSESLFVETYYGKAAGMAYVKGTRSRIANNEPIIGPYGVNKEGSGDMYYKGGNLLNMVRAIIDNDTTWLHILRGLNQQFYHQTVTTTDVVNYINQQSHRNLTPVFNQYLRYNTIPVLEITERDKQLYARWIANDPDFNMPLRLRAKGGQYQWVQATTHLTPLNLPGITRANIEMDTDVFYAGLLVE